MHGKKNVTRFVSKKVKKLLKDKSGIQLDIGGGENPQPGFVCLDKRKLPSVDIVHDLENPEGIPLPDNSVVRVVASHVLQHICPKKLLFVMEEIHRICKDGAQVLISVPYVSSASAVQDPTCCNFFNEITFMYFDKASPLWNIYKPSPFKIVMDDFNPSSNLEVILEVVKCDRKEEQQKEGSVKLARLMKRELER